MGKFAGGGASATENEPGSAGNTLERGWERAPAKSGARSNYDLGGPVRERKANGPCKSSAPLSKDKRFFKFFGHFPR